MLYRLICLIGMSVVAVCTFGQGTATDRPGQALIRSMAEYERLVKHYRYSQPDSATYFANQGLAVARRTHDRQGEASMLMQLGMIDDNDGKFEDSEKKYQQALTLFKRVGVKKGVAAATIRIGVVALRNGNYDKAVGFFLQAMKTSEEIHDAFGLMEANYSISWAHLDHQKYDLALQYLKIAEQFNDSLPFSNISLNIYNHFGVVYRQLGRYKEARSYLEKGIRFSNAPEYQGLNITIINNLALVLAKEGLTAQAVALQEEALVSARKIDNYLRELQALLGLARTYKDVNSAKAIFYLKQGVARARKKKAYKQEMRFLKEITELYKSQGEYKEALAMKEREHTLADSAFYKSMSRHIETLKAEYELSKSKARIKELSYLNAQHKLGLEKSLIVRNVTFTGIALLLVILGLLYNRYRLKQRSNERLQTQQDQISHKNQVLQRLVDEKEWLLKEVHHRVKNNLHTITSLLESQSAYLENDALTAIRDSQHRVFAMSLIHQKLYQSNHVATIDMSVYLHELVHYLEDSFNARHRICFQLQLEPIQLDVSQAVPLGLILNEAITNAVKYAFPDEKNGIIAIAISQSTEGRFLFTLADNGIGLPPDFDIRKASSLGMKLMRGLSKELEAQFRLESRKGTRIEIEFAMDMALQQIQQETSRHQLETAL